MRKSEYLPTHIQDRISYEERVQRARDMAKEEKEMAVLAEMEEFYAGKSTDQSLNYDHKEINSFMSIK